MKNIGEKKYFLMDFSFLDSFLDIYFFWNSRYESRALKMQRGYIAQLHFFGDRSFSSEFRLRFFENVVFLCDYFQYYLCMQER